MKRSLIPIFLLSSVSIFAQTQSVASGSIKDESSQPVPNAEVYIPSLNQSILSDAQGNFEISLPEGSHEIEVHILGFKTQNQTVNINGQNIENINFILTKEETTENIDLQGTTITATRNRANEAELLNIQRRSVNIVQAIGAQELERKGVSDVASAVAKVSGVSKQEGTNSVYIRGLGDRYITTTMNGLPLPSNDPEFKNIDLGLFSTDIVDHISIDKVYTPKVLGDFSGGSIDIVSKNFTDKSLFEVSVGSNINSNAIGKSDFMLQNGPNKSGFFTSNVPNDPLNNFNFENKLNPESSSTIGYNFGLRGGKSFRVGAEGNLGLFAMANFDSGYHYTEGINQTVNAQGGLGGRLKSFDPHEKYSYKTNSTGMLNANYKINNQHRIRYNFLFINSSDQSREMYYGMIRDMANDGDILVTRNTYTQNTLFINQLLGEHKINDRFDLDWGLAYNNIESDLPDRTQNILKHENDAYYLTQNSSTDNHRYFHNLTEDEIAANVVLTYHFNEAENGLPRGNVKVGYNGRMKKRDFEAIQFNFALNRDITNSNAYDPNNLDAFFNQQNYQNGYFNINTYNGNLSRQTYNADQDIHAAFASVEYNFTDKLSAIVGLRYENIVQGIEWRTQLDASGRSNTLDQNYFLPSLVMKYEINNRQNLRFAASKTYTLPQFKERALFLYEDVTQTKYGNPFLTASDNYNVDLKWELFPSRGEILSLAAFGKYIQNPINEVVIASSTNDISWINGDYGYVVGAEIEARKNIFNFGEEGKNTLSAGLNASYMKTEQEFDAEKVRRETNGMYNLNLTTPKERLTGASDFLLNADVSYVKAWNNDAEVMATLVYAYYSDRIYAYNNEQKGNLIDKGFGTLDFILRTKLNKNIGINFAARNILNQKFERIQDNASGEVPALTYKKGSNFGLSINYQF